MPAGIYPTKTGFRVVAVIGRGKGKRTEKAFPAGTSVRTMTRWQEDARRDLRAAPPPPVGCLESDVATYLDARASMPTHGDRARILRLWVAALGGARTRDSVTALEIRRQLEAWHVAGSSEGTCNRRRTALQSFYTVLNGRSGANPVRDVPKYREPDQPPRRLDYATLDAILAAMPDVGQKVAGESPAAISQTKARLRVIAYTGLPHSLVAKLRPAHLVAESRLLFVQGRGKGAGTGDRWHPLSVAGVQAVEALFAAKATGAFSRSSMHKSFRRAAVKVGRPDVRPYDLRHLFGQTVLRLTHNRAATRDLMLHRSDKTTARYVAAEIPGELWAALDRIDTEVGTDVVDAGCGTEVETPPKRRVSR